jgi:aryl carrier-like protein
LENDLEAAVVEENDEELTDYSNLIVFGKV